MLILTTSAGPAPCAAAADRSMPERTPTFQPLYLQIKALLEQSLDAGEWRPGAAIPSEAVLARALRRRRRGRCARRSTRSPPRTSSCGGRARARSSRRTPRKQSSLFRFLRIRRNDEARRVSRQAGVLDVRRGKASAEAARAARPQAGRPVILLRRVLEIRGEPVGAGRDHAARRAVPGTDQGAGRRLPGLDVQLLRDPVRRPDAQGAGEAPRRCRRRARARGSSACASGDPLLAVDRVTLHLRRPARSSGGAASARRSDTTTSTRSAERRSADASAFRQRCAPVR